MLDDLSSRFPNFSISAICILVAGDISAVIFSSLIDEEMRRKGKAVGADEQLSKPEIGHLVEILDYLLEKRGIRHE